MPKCEEQNIDFRRIYDILLRPWDIRKDFFKKKKSTNQKIDKLD